MRPLSEAEETAFAAIVARLGDPEWRRLRRRTVMVTLAVLALASVLLTRVLHWPWATVPAFAATFVGGLLVGWRVTGPGRRASP